MVEDRIALIRALKSQFLLKLGLQIKIPYLWIGAIRENLSLNSHPYHQIDPWHIQQAGLLDLKITYETPT